MRAAAGLVGSMAGGYGAQLACKALYFMNKTDYQFQLSTKTVQNSAPDSYSTFKLCIF
jgi:hypothetical protein